MTPYSAEGFEPPAPLAYVTLQSKETAETWANVPMLIDTGADVTLIPRQVIERLHLEITSARHYELVGFDGSTSLAQVVHVDLVFLGRTFRGQFLLIEGEWGILGRNVLNAVKLLLDGPNFIWSEPK